MAELRIEAGANTLHLRTYRDESSVVLSIYCGPVHVWSQMTPEQALQFASMLAHASGIDDPIPVGEATISDWQTLEAAQ